MLNLTVRRLAFAALFAGLAQAGPSAEILIVDAKSQPESLTIAPGGILFVGSASSPFVYKVRPDSGTVEKFVDASAEGAGTFFFGTRRFLYITDTANGKIYKLPRGASAA
jgi:hypothetical protein